MSSPVLQPVFLIGAGRSGTKFLRNVLGQSQDIAMVPYDVGYIWRYTHETILHDEFDAEMATPEVIDYVHKQLPRLADWEHKPEARFLIEKSVPNSLRPQFLNRVYPEAKFIHLIRDGRSVVESSLRQWVAPPEKGYLWKKLRYFPIHNYRYAIWYAVNFVKGVLFSGRGQSIWGPRYKGIEADIKSLPLDVVCARQWRRCVEVSLAQLQEIPAEQVLEVRYEDIIADESRVEDICKFIGIRDPATVVSHFRDTRLKTNLDKWREKLTGDRLENVLLEINPLLDKLGYLPR